MPDIATVTAVLSREWNRAAGATEQEVENLIKALPFSPPEAYLSLLRLSNGGEGELSVQPLWFQLFDAEWAIKLSQDPHYQAEYPEHYFFGSNGGLESIAMHRVPEGAWPIVAIDTIAGIESSMAVASSFGEFLSFIGIRSEDAA